MKNPNVQDGKPNINTFGSDSKSIVFEMCHDIQTFRMGSLGSQWSDENRLDSNRRQSFSEVTNLNIYKSTSEVFNLNIKAIFLINITCEHIQFYIVFSPPGLSKSKDLQKDASSNSSSSRNESKLASQPERWFSS